MHQTPRGQPTAPGRFISVIRDVVPDKKPANRYSSSIAFQARHTQTYLGHLQEVYHQNRAGDRAGAIAETRLATRLANGRGVASQDLPFDTPVLPLDGERE